MGFKLPDSYYEQQKEIYDKKYVIYNDQEIHITEFEDKSITLEMQQQMMMNSYARDDLPPKLTNEALIESAKHYLNNCEKPRLPCVTYDEALIHRILPELIKRLEDK